MPHKNQDENEVQSSSGSAAGESARLDPQPSPEEGTNDLADTPVAEIPIGFPVIPDEFKRLKKKAEQSDKEDAPDISA